MPTKGEWALIALILGAIAFVGVTLYLTRKSAAQGLTLKRVINQQSRTVETIEQNVVLENEERVQMIRDSEGSLSEVIIHRKVIE